MDPATQMIRTIVYGVINALGLIAVIVTINYQARRFLSVARNHTAALDRHTAALDAHREAIAAQIPAPSTRKTRS